MEQTIVKIGSKDLNARHGRFKDASWYNPDDKLDISVVGQGGVGSFLSLFLSRIGDNNFYLYENPSNIYEITNTSGQLVRTNELGLQKDVVAKMNMEDFSATTNINLMGLFTEDSMVTKYMFTPLDNIETRKIAFNLWKEAYGEDEDALFIDLRMTAELCEVYFVTKKYFKQYEESLEGEFPELTCSYKATSHCGALCASIGVAGFTNFLSNLYTDTDIREVPFKVRVDLPFMRFINDYGTT